MSDRVFPASAASKPAVSDGLCDASALTLLEMQRRREVSAAEILDAHLRRIHEINPQVNALVTLAGAFVFMFSLVLAANLFADAIRDAFDPRYAGVEK